MQTKGKNTEIFITVEKYKLRSFPLYNKSICCIKEFSVRTSLPGLLHVRKLWTLTAEKFPPQKVGSDSKCKFQVCCEIVVLRCQGS